MKRLIPIIIMIIAIIYSSGCLKKDDNHEEEYQGIIDENASLSCRDKLVELLTLPMLISVLAEASSSKPGRYCNVSPSSGEYPSCQSFLP